MPSDDAIRWAEEQAALPPGPYLSPEAEADFRQRLGIPVREVDVIDTTSIWFVSWGPPFPRNRWERWCLKARVFRWRLRDAWLVLQGKADID